MDKDLCDRCVCRNVCLTWKDIEPEFKRDVQGFCQDFVDEDNVIDWTPNNNFWSMRQTRAGMLQHEFGHWSSIGAFDDFIETLGHELSWRMITRIIHKLERKRGAR